MLETALRSKTIPMILQILGEQIFLLLFFETTFDGMSVCMCWFVNNALANIREFWPWGVIRWQNLTVVLNLYSFITVIQAHQHCKIN